MQRPSSSTYYIGIGMAMKRNSPAQYPNIAKKNAISDLASEIKVRVSGNSVLKQYENNDEFRETFTNNTKVSVQEDLEEFEQVDAWENESEFWVYYRLSKQKYREIKERKINAAIESGKSFVAKAESLKSAGKYQEAIKNYFKAFLEVQKYLDEDLRTNMDGKEVYFAAELLSRVEASLADIQLEAIYPHGKSSYTAVWGQQISPGELRFKVSVNGSSAGEGIRLGFSSDRARTMPEEASTNQNGIAGTSLKVSKGLKRREVLAKVILDDLGNRVLKAYIRKLNIPSTRYFIEVRDPGVQVKSEEKELGKDRPQTLASAFSSALSSEGFVSGGEYIDYIAEIKTDTRKGDVNDGFHSAYLNGSLLVRNRSSNEVIFKFSLNDIKGVGLDFNSASRKAYEEATKELERKAVWQFMEQMR